MPFYVRADWERKYLERRQGLYKPKGYSPLSMEQHSWDASI